ncbi:nucleotidyltransferase family protein [Neotabrizicola shimadae]|uniref:Nucleotidyltransferase family protein n=1 Tax=Neotabrizicola shimadae TaxID=2807096 RepID=A0A8G0ZXI6_9RHOB|nr:nucleotidyltransferase family protein [Neotabrizicola shimadae]QYZ69879.1 nucleotidyltransferase family protein [Neotabrizicola shimadae]
MPDQPRSLMLFAAGFGTRMGRLTADRPKPLIEVAGKPLIDHALALAEGAGIGRVVVNLHYRGGQLADHLAGRGVALSWERERILETGGGLKAALPLLGPGPVLILNSDGVWTGANPLEELLAAWDGARMGALLLLLPVREARGRDGKGDFALDGAGRISRGAGGEDQLYVGASILDPAALEGIGDEVFSLNLPWNRLIAEGRAFGVQHSGGWCDVGHPAGIAEAEAMLREAGHG